MLVPGTEKVRSTTLLPTGEKSRGSLKARKMLGTGRAEYLREVASRVEAVEDWRADEIERVLRALQTERELSSNQAFQPIRAAVTGTLVSPPLFESIELLGRERALARLRRAAPVGSS